MSRSSRCASAGRARQAETQARRNDPPGSRRRSGRDARQSPPACRSPASARRGRGAATPSLSGVMFALLRRNRYHERRNSDNVPRWTTARRKRAIGGSASPAGSSAASSALGGAITDLVAKRKLDAAAIADIEDALIRADLGLETAAHIAAALGEGRYDAAISPEEVKAVLAGGGRESAGAASRGRSRSTRRRSRSSSSSSASTAPARPRPSASSPPGFAPRGPAR